MKWLLVILLALSTQINAQQYTGNEVYNYTHYNKSIDLTYNITWYRRYHKGFFIEMSTDNTNKALDGAVGYQHYVEGLIFDLKLGPKDTSTLSILKRF